MRRLGDAVATLREGQYSQRTERHAEPEVAHTILPAMTTLMLCLFIEVLLEFGEQFHEGVPRGGAEEEGGEHHAYEDGKDCTC